MRKTIKRIFYTAGWIFLIYAFFHVLVYPGTKTGSNKYASVRPTVKHTLPYLQATRYIPPTKRPTWSPKSTPAIEFYLPTSKPIPTFYMPVFTETPTVEPPHQIDHSLLYIASAPTLFIYQNPTYTPKPTSGTYVLNTNTHVFHYPYCHSVDQMLPKNTQYFTGTRKQVTDKGYRPCGNCNP